MLDISAILEGAAYLRLIQKKVCSSNGASAKLMHSVESDCLVLWAAGSRHATTLSFAFVLKLIICFLSQPFNY